MNFLAIIPARYASTRFPGKPLAEINGKPMIQLVYQQVCKAIDTVVVATDDKRIFNAVESFNGKAIMTSVDHMNGTERCNEALKLSETLFQKTFDVVINVQGDEPFIQPSQIKKLKNCFSKKNYQITTLAKRISNVDELRNPNVVKIAKTKDGSALYFSRSIIPYSRDLELKKIIKKFIFFKHIGIYAYRSDILKEIVKLPKSTLETTESLEQLRWLENGYEIQIEETDTETIGIDTPEDLQRIKVSF